MIYSRLLAVFVDLGDYREELLTVKITIALRTEHNNNPESNEKCKSQDCEKRKKLLNKQKDLRRQMKEAEFLIEEGTNRFESALENDLSTEAHAVKLLIVGICGRLTEVNEQQRQVTY